MLTKINRIRLWILSVLLPEQWGIFISRFGIVIMFMGRNAYNGQGEFYWQSMDRLVPRLFGPEFVWEIPFKLRFWEVRYCRAIHRWEGFLEEVSNETYVDYYGIFWDNYFGEWKRAITVSFGERRHIFYPTFNLFSNPTLDETEKR